MERPLIEANNVHFAYGHGSSSPIQALRGVDLEVAAGEYLAVVGHNGSGKSTLAKCLNSLLLPQSGQVLVEGRDTADESALVAIRSAVGIVLQNPDNQFVATTIEEEIAFGPENLGVPRAELRERVDSALELTGLGTPRDRSPHLLSAGQKARLAIASILAMGPRCLILDESTALLDPGSRLDVLQLIEKLHGEGLAVVAITHSMDEAILAERVVVLDAGRLVLQGTPREVFGQPRLLAELSLSLPSVAALSAGLRRRGLAIPEDVMNVSDLAAALVSAPEACR